MLYNREKWNDHTLKSNAVSLTHEDAIAFTFLRAKGQPCLRADRQNKNRFLPIFSIWQAHFNVLVKYEHARTAFQNKIKRQVYIVAKSSIITRNVTPGCKKSGMTFKTKRI